MVLAVSALGWEKVPAIPAGRRAEYFLLEDDGAYRFGYDNGEGQSAAVRADQNNQVSTMWTALGRGSASRTQPETLGSCRSWRWERQGLVQWGVQVSSFSSQITCQWTSFTMHKQ